MSNMAIMRVGAPSGFEAQKEGLLGNPLVKKVETAGGQLIIYFDDVSIQMPIQIRIKEYWKIMYFMLRILIWVCPCVCPCVTHVLDKEALAIGLNFACEIRVFIDIRSYLFLLCVQRTYCCRAIFPFRWF